MIDASRDLLGKVFDAVERGIESHGGHRAIGVLLVSSYLGALFTIELKRQGWLPTALADLVPESHLAAIQLAFSLLLFVEVVGLILAVSHSISTSVGKQFELLSLILLRDVFKTISNLSEPVTWDKVAPVIVDIASSASAALAIFMVIAFFYRAQCRRPITHDLREQSTFISAKKCIALTLLLSFFFLVGRSLVGAVNDSPHPSPFESLYTLLIFTDVLLVLLSLRYSSSYHVAFRNSGFAVATVMIRISLTAPPVLGAGLGAATALFALGVTLAYNRFATILAEPCHI